MSHPKNDTYFESKWEEYSIIPTLLKQAANLPEFNDDKAVILGKVVRIYRQLRQEDDGGILWQSYQKEHPNTLNDLHWWDQIYAK